MEKELYVISNVQNYSSILRMFNQATTIAILFQPKGSSDGFDYLSRYISNLFIEIRLNVDGTVTVYRLS